ncbi:tetratricopeptide repeat protein, partial [Actinomyces oris]|uniref:tetratricopeptide repeat protein n=3 Tax=Actinomyces TaxID=1654 RepID=UPI0028D4C4C7
RTRTLGPHHPDTLTSQNNLAKACHKAGKLNEAIPLFEQTLDARIRILGPHHPDTLTTRNNLADAYRAAGRIEEAEALFETPSDSEDEQNGTEKDLDQETGD